MWREVNPICLYLRGIVRAEFGKEFAIYAKNPQVDCRGKKKTTNPDLPLGNSSTSRLLSGSGVLCYINILEALQKGWHSHHVCGAWLIGLCVWRTGMERIRKWNPQGASWASFFPWPLLLLTCWKGVSETPVWLSRWLGTLRAPQPSLHPNSALPSGLGGGVLSPAASCNSLQQSLRELPSAQKLLPSLHTKICVNSVVLVYV